MELVSVQIEHLDPWTGTAWLRRGSISCGALIRLPLASCLLFWQLCSIKGGTSITSKLTQLLREVLERHFKKSYSRL
jgi:hypothetical protein